MNTTKLSSICASRKVGDKRVVSATVYIAVVGTPESNVLLDAPAFRPVAQTNVSA